MAKRKKRKKMYPISMKGLLTIEQAYAMTVLKKKEHTSYSALIREAVDLLIKHKEEEN